MHLFTTLSFLVNHELHDLKVRKKDVKCAVSYDAFSLDACRLR